MRFLSVRWLAMLALLLALAMSACQPIRPVATQPASQALAAKLQNAMSAAPLAIAKEATILDWPAKEGDAMVVLRQGTNGWTCLTDWPASPGNDPQCNDPVWTAWNDAYAKGETPEVTRPGVAYMLMGGSDPSNTEPYATEPPPGEDWVSLPPHVMLLVPGGFDADQFTTDHHAGKPYIMWAGTPYEHLMMPLQQDASH